MNETNYVDTQPAAISGPLVTSRALQVARNLAGFLIITIAIWLYRSPLNAVRWLAVPVTIVVLAAAVAGLLALFFSGSQRKNIGRNFTLTMWALGAAWMLANWGAAQQDAIEAARAAPQAQSAAAPAENEFVPIIGGFVTGNTYRKYERVSRAVYVMGVVDGLLLAPAFRAPKTAMQWLEKCVPGVQAEQALAIVDNWMAQHPELWQESMNTLVHTAMQEACSRR